MIVTIEKSKAVGRIAAPPSKSMAHRYLICGALSGGSEISGVAFSEDIKATLSCLEALGAKVEINKDTVKLGGIATGKNVISTNLYCNESGSTLRFLIPLCMLSENEFTLSGTERLFSRSLSVYEELCREQGITFKQNENSVTVKGKLNAGKFSVSGNISSQFISGLMFALPNLLNDSEIEITGGLESGSYLNLTLKALADFGVRISRAEENIMYVKGSQEFKKRKLCVEGDYSNAAFFESLNLFGGNVVVTGLQSDSVQGDKVYKEIFPQLVKGCPTIDISDCPDLGPILMALAATLNGAVFTGTHRLKIKESDRGRAMAEELAKFGCKVIVDENTIEVRRCTLKTPVLPLSGHNDHRIVMAVAVLCTITGGKIYGAQAVSKSFPDFFEKLQEVGVKLKVENA